MGDGLFLRIKMGSRYVGENLPVYPFLEHLLSSLVVGGGIYFFWSFVTAENPLNFAKT